MRRSPSRALPARSWWRVKRSNKTPRAARRSPTGCVSSQRFRTFLSNSIKPLSKMRTSSDRRAWPSVAGALLTATGLNGNDRSIEAVVDRLLATPHYGERWGRHWLDVVHYGDTHGYDKDKRRDNAWPYRDYVIAAFNSGLPYGRFIREQVAGDALWRGDPRGAIATGFIAAVPCRRSVQGPGRPGGCPPGAG